MIGIRCILSLAVLVVLGSATPTFEGCGSPDRISIALGKLHGLDWQKVSLDQVRSVWPSEVAGKECDRGGCPLAWAPDRIISGTCECCTTFSFKTRGTESKPRTEWLEAIIINHAARSRAEVVAIGKKFADALGLAPSQVRTIGVTPEDNFHWETAGGVSGQMAAIVIRIHSVKNRWQLYLNASQNIPK